MGETSDIKKGVAINHQNEIYVVTEAQFVNPGKGAAFSRVKMKGLGTNKTIEITYKSGEKIDTVQVDHTNLQYLYHNGTFYSFMNQTTYETIDVEADLIGEDAKYLKEGIDVVAAMYNDRVIAIQLPKKIIYKVVEAPPAVKGNSASGNVTKTVKFDNGLEAQAPIFIKEGEEIIINTETGEYCGRSNE